MKTTFISITPDAEKQIVYCARVSSPKQSSDDGARLINYCVKNGHWSVLEQAFMTVEVETSRAIAAQLLRHRSFTFQEFSQRYAAATSFETYPARRQDSKNRQNSIDDMSDEDKTWFADAQTKLQTLSAAAYQQALARGIAKEQARFLLPLSTLTKLYISGSIRSWVHYLQTRTHESTQLEHREIANEIKQIFITQLPMVAAALDWEVTP